MKGKNKHGDVELIVQCERTFDDAYTKFIDRSIDR
tara:strand:- start:544 stop:648 length:105 start_codon:yes stop_codon:yes gene_type:complete